MSRIHHHRCIAVIFFEFLFIHELDMMNGTSHSVLVTSDGTLMIIKLCVKAKVCCNIGWKLHPVIG